MQAESLVTVVVVTDQFGFKLVNCLQSIPKNWQVLIASPSQKLPPAIKHIHPLIQHWKQPKTVIKDFALVRNQALSQVKTEWAFFLDSDEVVDNFDLKYLESLFINHQLAGLSVSRSDIFYGRKLLYGEAGRQTLVRLIRVGHAQFVGSVHEVALVSGQVAESKIAITHFSHESIQQFIAQVSQYSNMATATHQHKSRWRLLGELMTYPPLKFVVNYICKLGFLDGWRGLSYAIIMSLHSTLVRLMVLELSMSRHPGPGPVFFNSGIYNRHRVIQVGLSLSLFALIPFGQLLRWSITDHIAIYPHDIILSLLVFISAITTFHKRSSSTWKKLQPWRWELLVWGYFWLLGAIKLLISNDFNQFLIMSRLGVYALGLLIALKSLSIFRLKQDGSRPQAQHFSIACLGLFAWLSFILYAVFPDMRSLVFFGWDDHYYRLIGTLFDPNYSGLVLSVGVLMVIGWLGLKYRSYSVINRWLGVNLSLFFAICLGLTFSRSSWLSLGVATSILMVVTLIRKQLELKHIGLVFVLGMLILTTVVLAPKPGGEGINLARSVSVNSRLAFDQYILRSLAPSDWVLGKVVDQPFVELNQLASTNKLTTYLDRSPNSPVAFHPKTANNLFVTSLLWGGVIGLTLVIILFSKWFWQLYKDSPIVLAILMAWLVHAQFNNSFLEPFVFLMVGGGILSLLVGKKFQ